MQTDADTVGQLRLSPRATSVQNVSPDNTFRLAIVLKGSFFSILMVFALTPAASLNSGRP